MVIPGQSLTLLSCLSFNMCLYTDTIPSCLPTIIVSFDKATYLSSTIVKCGCFPFLYDFLHQDRQNINCTTWPLDLSFLVNYWYKIDSQNDVYVMFNGVVLLALNGSYLSFGLNRSKSFPTVFDAINQYPFSASIQGPMAYFVFHEEIRFHWWQFIV